jgi:acyl carrier protein
VQIGNSAPTRDEVRRRLVELIHEIAGIPLERITDEATVDDELRMQSVAFVELQVAIEDTYEIQVDPIQVVELNQFGAITNYIYDCVASTKK